MTGTLFVLSLVFLLIIFFIRHKIVNVINSNFELENKIQSEWIVYILTILFIAVISAGMLLDNTKEKYANISDGFEKIRSKNVEQPMRFFDISFDIFD